MTLSIYGLNLWLPTIIKQFGGGSDLQVGFLSSIPYVFGIIGLLIIPRSTDRLNDRYGHLGFLYAVGACAIVFKCMVAFSCDAVGCIINCCILFIFLLLQFSGHFQGAG